MSISALPIEILRMITESLQSEREIFTLLQVNRSFYEVVTPCLYQYNIQNSGSSGLHWCAMTGNEACVRSFLSFNANVDAAMHEDDSDSDDSDDNNDTTPIMLAIKHDHFSVAKLLLEHGATVQSEEGFMVHAAVLNRNQGLVTLLLDHGASINEFDEEGGTPLNTATKSGDLEMMQFLIDQGADVNACGPETEDNWATYITPLHTAAGGRNDNCVVTLLLDHGANTEVVDNGEKTPLHWAVKMETDGRLRALLERGANVNSRDINGDTPLHISAAKGKEANIQALIEYGADPTIMNNQRQTPNIG